MTKEENDFLSKGNNTKKLVRIDPDLHKHLKIYCADNDFRMTDIINYSISAFLKASTNENAANIFIKYSLDIRDSN